MPKAGCRSRGQANDMLRNQHSQREEAAWRVSICTGLNTNQLTMTCHIVSPYCTTPTTARLRASPQTSRRNLGAGDPCPPSNPRTKIPLTTSPISVFPPVRPSYFCPNQYACTPAPVHFLVYLTAPAALSNHTPPRPREIAT